MTFPVGDSPPPLSGDLLNLQTRDRDETVMMFGFSVAPQLNMLKQGEPYELQSGMMMMMMII